MRESLCALKQRYPTDDYTSPVPIIFLGFRVYALYLERTSRNLKHILQTFTSRLYLFVLKGVIKAKLLLYWENASVRPAGDRPCRERQGVCKHRA
jgi:hypothetical protein